MKPYCTATCLHLSHSWLYPRLISSHLRSYQKDKGLTSFVICFLIIRCYYISHAGPLKFTSECKWQKNKNSNSRLFHCLWTLYKIYSEITFCKVEVQMGWNMFSRHTKKACSPVYLLRQSLYASPLYSASVRMWLLDHIKHKRMTYNSREKHKALCVSEWTNVWH